MYICASQSLFSHSYVVNEWQNRHCNVQIDIGIRADELGIGFIAVICSSSTIGWTIKLVSFFFFKESNFQIVRVFCATKFIFLIFDTFLKKTKTDQLYGPPYILSEGELKIPIAAGSYCPIFVGSLHRTCTREHKIWQFERAGRGQKVICKAVLSVIDQKFIGVVSTETEIWFFEKKRVRNFKF
jgi:hypothetical protein